jgi:probable phosphoglycerate mutase
MATKILLVRHGQTQSNANGFYMGRSDEDMNEAGYAQVRRLSSRLAGLPISSIHTSPLLRANATANVLAEPHSLEPSPLADLTEIHIGEWQGLHTDEVRRRWPEILSAWRNDPSEVTIPGGESLFEVTDRAIRAFKDIVRAQEGKQSVIVTHEVIIKVVVAYVLQTTNSIYRRFNINNASLSVIEVVKINSHVARLNDTTHLEN